MVENTELLPTLNVSAQKKPQVKKTKPVKKKVVAKKAPVKKRVVPKKKKSAVKKTRAKKVVPKAKARVVKKKSVPKKKKTNVKVVRKLKQKTRELRDDKDIAMDFAIQVHKQFDAMIKATVLFGSQAKDEGTGGSDIDIIIIVDDAGINWDMELVAWYREELGKLLAKNEYAKDLHVNTIKLTTWWNDLMHGDPVVINILRYGQTLVDIGGFFKPLKALLLQGKIHATPEAVHAALQRAPMHLARSQYAEMGAIEGVYWTMVDAAQAALITLGQLPPSPEKIAGMLNEYFVQRGLLKSEYVKWYHDIFHMHKGISHGNHRIIKGAEIDQWQERAELFLRKMTEIIDKLIDASREEHHDKK